MRGAYPIHFHRTGDNEGSYVKDCAIYKSFYRCLTLHETNKVTVTDNVGFDVTGAARAMQGHALCNPCPAVTWVAS